MSACACPRATPSDAALPSSWSWQRVTREDGEARRTWCGVATAPGSYTGLVLNQHRSKWCGCCYLVSVVQAIEDRANALIGEADALEMHLIARFDMQQALDDYDNYQRRLMPIPWNACRGGDPLKVMRAIEEGAVPLRLRTSENGAWHGFPRATDCTSSSGSADTALRITDCRKLEPNVRTVQEEILRHGSVVLGVNAGLLDARPRRGRIRDGRSRGGRSQPRRLCDRLGNEGRAHILGGTNFGASPTCQRIVPPTLRVRDAGHQRVHACKTCMDGRPGESRSRAARCRPPPPARAPSPWYACRVFVPTMRLRTTCQSFSAYI